MTKHRSVSTTYRRQRPRPVADLLRETIESERGRLLKAEALLGCLKISMESDDLLEGGTHYADVAEVACDLLRQSIDALDSVNLERAVRRNGVRDEFRPSAPSIAGHRESSYSQLLIHAAAVH